MSEDIVIRVENLSKRYRLGETGAGTLKEAFAQWSEKRRGKSPDSLDSEAKEIWALRDVSFEVRRGEVLGVIGRNGAGKSTLLKILTRITEPTSGRAVLKGRAASLLEVGTGFHPDLTGRENIYLNGAILGMKKAEIARKFDEIVAFAELERFIDTPVKRYSSGMYVRLAFAVAAHLDADILLVDEVLAVGDAAFQRKCLGKMAEVTREGRTVLFVSHNMPAIQRLCATAFLLEKGRIAANGSAATVVDAYYKATMDRHNLVQDVRSAPEGAVRFLRWRISDGCAGSPHTCYTREPCVISLQLVVRRIVNRANFGLAIWTDDGILVWTGRNIDYGGECVFLKEGLYELSFVLPSFPVRPGTYQIYVTANNIGEGTLDGWYAQPRLCVLPKHDPGLPPEWQGILNIESQFQIMQVEENMSATRNEVCDDSL